MKVESRSLSQFYGNTFALQDVDFLLKSNTICGLLGRNGAGKTTLMHLLTGQLYPSSGKLLIDGQVPFENRNLLKNVCFIKESGNFKKNFKISEILNMAPLFHPNWNRELAHQLLNTFHLDPRKPVKALSKGMESALGIIVGLASRAPITIFDEPYIGMDAVARQQFYDLLVEEYSEHPRTMILSTHLIDEISKIFEEVMILKEGKLLLHEEAENLRNSGFTVSGPTQAVEKYTQGKTVLHSESFGGTKTSAFFGAGLDRSEATKLGLHVEPLPIQNLMIYLTSEEKGEIHL